MKKIELIRLLLTVRQMNAGQFWALMRSLGVSPVLQPPPMDGDEVERVIEKIGKK